MKAKAKHEGPLKIPMPFDAAMKLAVGIKPPPEGWAQYEKNLNRDLAEKAAGAA